jgi:hypothetical protein
MVQRPLAQIRPLGPLIESDNDGDGEDTQDGDTNVSSTDEQDPILEVAEKWYKSISKERNKRKMMKNYLMSVSDLSASEVEDKLDESGL